MVAWNFGASEEEAAPAVIEQTRARTQGRRAVAWISDGKRIYARQIRRVYRDPLYTGRRGRPRLVPTPGVALVQAVKQRQGRRVVKVEVRTLFGEPPEIPYVVCEERLNGVLRDRLNCLTRKTHGFAKTTATWDAAVRLALFEHNWLRAHPALQQKVPAPENGRRYRRRSPAMAMGLSDHLWSWEEFLHLPMQQHS